jgi:hypothetical protein
MLFLTPIDFFLDAGSPLIHITPQGAISVHAKEALHICTGRSPNTNDMIVNEGFGREPLSFVSLRTELDLVFSSAETIILEVEFR